MLGYFKNGERIGCWLCTAPMRVGELLSGGSVEIGQVPGDLAPLRRHHLIQDQVPHAHRRLLRQGGPAVQLRDPALE